MSSSSFIAGLLKQFDEKMSPWSKSDSSSTSMMLLPGAMGIVTERSEEERRW